MPADQSPKQSDATFRFRLHSGEILDDEGVPTGITLQDLYAAAEARFVRHFAADPQERNVIPTSERPPHPAVMKIVRLLARQAARDFLAKASAEKDP